MAPRTALAAALTVALLTLHTGPAKADPAEPAGAPPVPAAKPTSPPAAGAEQQPPGPSEAVDPKGVSITATGLTASNFRLLASPYSSLIDDLDAALPNVSVATVVADGNRSATSCRPEAASLLASFCWNSGDNDVPYWYPQGITTSADAYETGTYKGDTVILLNWYDDGSDGIDRGVRGRSGRSASTPGASSGTANTCTWPRPTAGSGCSTCSTSGRPAPPAAPTCGFHSPRWTAPAARTV